MFNQMGGASTPPIEMLMGLLGGGAVKTSSGSGDFGRLLGLLGPMPDGMPGDGIGQSIPELPVMANPDVAVLGNIPLVLPQDFSQALGLSSQPLPDTPNQVIVTENPQTMSLAQAELLVTDDGKNQALYLKILPDGTGPEMAQVLPEQDHGEEMVLPMRLRTVEQHGNRLIAEAELQTATGKDASIRLRLELAGSPDKIQETKPVSGIDSKPSTGIGKDLSLPRLLNNLDVKSVVIEPVGNDGVQMSKDILPRIVAIPRNFTGLKPTFNSPAAANSETVAPESESLSATLKPIGGTEGSRLADTGTGWMMSDNNSAGTQAGNPTGAESNLVATTTLPVSEIGEALPRTGFDTDLSQVRFYNLDHKLDQLKQNPGQRIKIQLMPARLGSMELSIASQRGIVTVTLAVDSVQAKQAIERNLPQLEKSLATSGLRVDNFQLQVNQPSKGESYLAYQQQYDRQQGGFTGHQEQGFRQYSSGYNRPQQFNLPEADFQQTMVNCLA
jgi:hypothetical protein